MNGPRKRTGLALFLNVGVGIIFVAAALIVVLTVRSAMREQALVEARSKARIILDRNLATHTYFSRIMKPSIFEWSEPFRTKDYFDHTWMSSTFAVREIDKYFKSLSPSGYYFKDAAINARSPENEADAYERAFIERLNSDKALEAESAVRTMDGRSYLVVLRKGETMEPSCLRCHSTPGEAPRGLTDHYGTERSFGRKAGEAVSAVSLRIPLSEAFAAANLFSLKLSTILLAVLACLFAMQYALYRRYLLRPLGLIQEKAAQIATDEQHLGEEIAEPFGRELGDLTDAFNTMSVKLRHERDHLEELVAQRTKDLQESEEQYRSLFNNMLNGFAYCNMLYDDQSHPIDFVYLDVNKSFEQLTGLKDVIGKKVTEVMPDIRHLNPELFEIYGRVALTGVPETFEVNLIPLKKLLFVAVYSTRKDSFVAVFDDITDRKEAEEKLVSEHRRFQTLLENAPFGIMLVTPDNLIAYLNPRFTELLGYTVQDIPDGRTWFRTAYPRKEYRHQVISAWFEDLGTVGKREPRTRTFTATCKDGTEKVIYFIPVQLPSGERLVSLEDRTELYRYQENLAYLSTHDVLTQLMNRRSLDEVLNRAIAKAKRGTVSSLLYMDLDKFKEVNDTAGHSAGDNVLMELARILGEALRTEDLLFRLGGDEFAALLEGIGGAEAQAAAGRLCSLVAAHPFATGKGVFSLSLSVGLVEINGRLTVDDLLSRVDTAMYQAKGHGGNDIVVASSRPTERT